MPGRQHRRRPLLVGLASWVLVAAGLRVAVALPERCPTVTAASIDAAAGAAVGWLATNQETDGRWTYRYQAATDQSLGGYEITRHAGVLLALYQALGHGIAAAGPSAERGLAWASTHLVVLDDWSALADPGHALQTGATALLVAALVERRRVTGDHSRDGELERLGRFLLRQLQPSGAVPEAYDLRAGPTVGTYSRFSTGEAFLALAGLRRELGPAWDEPARRVGRYLTQLRDQDEGWFPAIPDHWAAYGLAEVARWPDGGAGEHDVDPGGVGAVRLASLLGVQVRYESQRTNGLPSRITRGRQTLGAGLGTLGEGLANLAALAAAPAAQGPLVARRDVLVERARCAAGMLVDRQLGAAAAADDPAPARAVGAWYQFGVTQMDDQQHPLSALLLVGDLLADDLPAGSSS